MAHDTGRVGRSAATARTGLRATTGQLATATTRERGARTAAGSTTAPTGHRALGPTTVIPPQLDRTITSIPGSLASTLLTEAQHGLRRNYTRGTHAVLPGNETTNGLGETRQK
jgi:hypothetical protein